MEFIKSTVEDGTALAQIRALAMQASLEALGRFDENRVRRRFLETFNPDETIKLVADSELLGFYVVRNRKDHVYLDHLYIKPEHQNKKLGKAVIEMVVKKAHSMGLPIRLGALRGSRSNDFYLQHGFIKTHEDEFDIYYENSINS